MLIMKTWKPALSEAALEEAAATPDAGKTDMSVVLAPLSC